MPYSVGRNGKPFELFWERWEDGKRVERRRIPKLEWLQHGFAHCETLEQAREVARTKKAEERYYAKKEKALARLRQAQEDTCLYLPSELVTKFEHLYVGKTIRAPHWETAKSVIRKVNLPLKEWYRQKHFFYEEFARRAYSPDYAGTIRRILNRYLDYVIDERGEVFRHLPTPSRAAINKIRRAYEAYKGRPRRRASGRMDFALLRQYREKFTPEEYHWLFIAIAFGLRPEEVDQLSDSTKWMVQVRHGKRGLHIYTPKKERDTARPLARWRRIPILTPEQEKAISYISAQVPIKRPTKVLKELRDRYGRKLTPYCGRKEFYPFWCAQYDKATVAKWMGHSDLSTGLRHYDDPEEDAPWHTGWAALG